MSLGSNEVVCLECGRVFNTMINWTHLRTHGMTAEDYYIKYPDVHTWSSDFIAKKSKRSIEIMKKNWAKPKFREMMLGVSKVNGKRYSFLEAGKPTRFTCDQVRERNLKSWKDPEYRKKMLEVISSNGSKVMNELWHGSSESSKRFRVMMSKVASNNLKRMWRDDAKFREVAILAPKYTVYMSGYFYSDKNDSFLFHRSSYELMAYAILDMCDNVVKYEVEALRIPYTSEEGVEHLYVPDITAYLIDGRIKVIEVKPDNFVEENRCKFEAAREYCLGKNYNFEVWTEKQLFDLNWDINFVMEV